MSEVDWIGRVPKYKHRAYEWLGVNKAEIAVMTELLLRGAQALGELRGRAARMEPIADLASLKPIVDGLVARGLMIEITPPGRGQIVTHNLYSGPEHAELLAQYASRGGRESQPSAPPTAPTENPAHEPASDRVAQLSSELADLSARVDRLHERIGRLEASLLAAPVPSAGSPSDVRDARPDRG